MSFGNTGFSFGQGANTGGGGGFAFGQQQQQQQQQPNTAGASGFGFGGQTGGTTAPFGASQTSQTTGGFGGFGSNTGGGFGQTGGTAGFGSTTGGGFGQTGGTTGSTFGQTTGGTTGGFGSTTGGGFGFGQSGGGTGFGTTGSTPAATTGGGGFGGFGTTPSTTTTTGFGQTTGGFGQSGSTGFGAAPSTTSGFGTGGTGFGSTPATTGGGFGSGFGTGGTATSGFGTAPAGGTGFGTAPAATGGFGTTSSGFGSTPATTGGFGAGSTTGGFGSTTGGGFGSTGGGGLGGFGGTTQQQAAVPASEQWNFKATEEKTSTNKGKLINNVYQSIASMDRFKNSSLEELRWEFLKAGSPAKSEQSQTPFGTTQPTAFGGTSAFGATQPATTTTTTFGTGTTGGFGTTGSGGFGFGQQQPQQSTAPTTGFGGFGTTQPSTTTTSTTGGGFGGFGTSTQPTTTGGGFGALGTTQPSTTGFSFGGAAAQPQQQQQQQQPSTTGFSFGGTTTQPQQQQQPATSGFSFGGTGTQPTGTSSTPGFSFDGAQQPAASTTTGTTGFSFGPQPTTAPATTGTTGFSFGPQPTTATTAATTVPTTGFSFGSAAQQQPTTTGTTGFSFSQPAATTAAPTTGFSFAPTTGTTSTTTAAPTGFGTIPSMSTTQFQPLAGNIDVQRPYGSNIDTWLKELEDTSGADEARATPPKRPMLTSTLLASPRPPARIRPRALPRKHITSLKDRMLLFEDEGTHVEDDDEILAPQYNIMKIRPKYPDEDSDSEAKTKGGEWKPKDSSQQKEHPTADSLFEDNGLDAARDKSRKQSILDEHLPVKRSILPKLTKSDYYTIPSMKELNEMSDQGRETVHNFIVGRKSFGEIKFFGETNVNGLDLDKLVVIENRMVEVYPEDVIPIEEKPPLGQELNKRAQITLWNIRPKRISNAKVFRQRLERKVIEFAGEMVDYNLQEGKWVFIVPHFSKYGLEDDSDEDEEPQPQQQQRPLPPASSKEQQQQQQQQRFKISLDEDLSEDEDMFPSEGSVEELMSAEEDDEDEEFEMEQEEIDQEHHLSTTSVASTATRSNRSFLPQQLGMDARKLHMIGEHFFAEEEEEEHEERIRSVKPRRVPSKPITRKEDTFGKVAISTEPRALLYRPIRGVATRQPSQPEPMMVSQREAIAKTFPRKKVVSGKIVPLYESPIPESNFTNSKDSILSLGRSFRVSFGPDGSIVIPTFATRPLDGGAHNVQTSSTNDQYSSLSMISVKKIQVLGVPSTTNGNFIDLQYIKPLETSLSSPLTYSTIDDHNIPTTNLNNDDQTVADIISQYITDAERQVQASNLSHSMKLTQQQHLLVWRLVQALFASEDETLKSQNYVEEIHRKRRLTKWLREAVSGAVQSQMNHQGSNYLAQIYSLLTGNRIAHASRLAMENRDIMLSTLISQAVSETNMQNYVRAQLDEWQKSGANDFISGQRLRILELICGESVDCENDKDQAQENGMLDWKRLFGVQLWYRTKPHQPIADAIQIFEDDNFDVRAHPTHVEEILLDKRVAPGGMSRQHILQQRRDICYHVIKLFCDNCHSLRSTLDPLTASYDLLDYRLSWHLYQVFRALHLSSEEISHEIHMNFAFQLQQAGLWHWAVYVLTHLEIPEEGLEDMMTENDSVSEPITQRKYPTQIVNRFHAIKESAIKEVIRRHISIEENEDDINRVKFLVDNLHIPNKWIQEAKAMRAALTGDHIKHFHYRIGAEQYQEAHRIIMTQVAPNLILSERLTELEDALLQLSHHKASILEWDSAGNVYLEYIKLRDRAKESGLLRAKMRSPLRLLKVLDTWSMWTVRFLPHNKQQQLRERVAIAEMTSQRNIFEMAMGKEKIPPGAYLHPQQANQQLLAKCINILDTML